MRTMRLVSAVLVGASVVAIVFLSTGGKPLPIYALFLMQLPVLAVFGTLLLKVGKSRPLAGTSAVPRFARIVASVAGLLGVAVVVINLGASMPETSPSGARVSSFGASSENGSCLLTYNETEVVERPMTECADFARRVELAFAGGWLVFSSISLWLAFLLPVSRPEADRMGSNGTR
jgi:hypothetical protein